MTSPQPPSALDGRCSAIYDNTLYVYTPSALLSLSLESGADWNTTDAGQSVTDAVCVTGSLDGTSENQGLYVVGGTSDNSTYSGLQRYSFSDNTWESINLNIADLQNRVNHSAIYIPGTSSILVYAGSNDANEDASTSTYEIPIDNGWIVQSRSDGGSPAGIQPFLLPWDNSTVVYVGGTSTNTEVFLYHGMSGWNTSQISLAEGIPSDAGVAILSNSDGSKILEIFDVTTSPNNVSYVALLQTGGQPAYPGESVTFASTSSSSANKEKRDWGNMPAYNTTDAPSTTRTSFSIAQSSNDLVVISGGSGNDCLSVFNQTQNSWVNTTKLFYNGDSASLQKPLTTSTSTASTSATSATATTSTTTAATSGGTSTSTGVIIGATLGSLLGIAAILIVLLVILRRLHGKKASSGGKGGRRFGSQDKDRLSFEDQGIEPLTMAAVPMARSNVHSAVDSLNMISGKFANDYRSSMAAGNGVGTRSLVPPAKSPMPTIASSRADIDEKEVMMLSTESNRPKGDRSTDEGWGKYFQDTKATDSPRTTMNSDISDMTKSDYRSSMWPHQMPEATSIALGALSGPKPLGQVSSGSPSTEHLPMSGNSHLHQGQSALIDSASLLSDDDDHSRHDAFSSGIPPSVQDGTWYMRPPSSNYTDSFYQPSAREPSGLQESISVPTDARSNGRRSSGILHSNYPRTNINSDMSWLNLHADK
ncbi:hypothetical protein UA08_04457 [Talaromyces atroroseus]|uniref:Pre-mRNA splicing factor CLF1 n=1 Tax=Talaromyces atroroseus TaxID=1441469 RepID=A0A225AZC8_TALAT|nr:hypothetical protein UA08_04457 [Talaromyces atroroseus]OKL59835.1 hypothetical protein UA08_04457 [Talaromyces atroroseus]